MEIDTLTEYVRYTLLKPSHIDFATIEEAVHGAGYTLKQLTLELKGEVVTEPCETCAGDVAVLHVLGTEQRIELKGDAPVGKTVRLKGSVTGWAGDHALLTVQEWHEEG